MADLEDLGKKRYPPVDFLVGKRTKLHLQTRLEIKHFPFERRFWKIDKNPRSCNFSSLSFRTLSINPFKPFISTGTETYFHSMSLSKIYGFTSGSESVLI